MLGWGDTLAGDCVIMDISGVSGRNALGDQTITSGIYLLGILYGGYISKCASRANF